jgi:hypothetical protein
MSTIEMEEDRSDEGRAQDKLMWFVPLRAVFLHHLCDHVSQHCLESRNQSKIFLTHKLTSVSETKSSFIQNPRKMHSYIILYKEILLSPSLLVFTKLKCLSI